MLMRAVLNNMSAPHIYLPDEDGIGYTYQGGMRQGWRICTVSRQPLPPTLPEIWAPVMASVSISLMILLVPSWRARGRPPRVRARSSGRVLAVRVLGVVGSLILLNVAGALSGPRPGRSNVPVQYGEFFGGTPRMLVIRTEGTTAQRRPVDGSNWIPGVHSRAGSDLAGSDLEEATIEYRRDASIVAYAGTPERKLSRPRLLSPSARSFLDLWWPFLGTMSISLLAIVPFGREVCREIRGGWQVSAESSSP
jgi:hypothetical protein